MRRILTGFMAVMAILLPVSATASDGVLVRLQEMHEMVLDDTQVFSASKTLAELDALAAKLPDTETQSKARGEIAYLRGFILSRMSEPEEALPHIQESLRIDVISKFLSDDDRSRTIYRLASNAEEAGEWVIAIKAYEDVIPLFDKDNELTESQRLGTRVRLGFVLHEAGRYKDAFELNKEILKRSEVLFGGRDARQNGVLTNLSQNAHKLGDLKSARLYLDRRLKTATENDDIYNIDDSLFQLGVLSFEEGNADDAKEVMQGRISLAEKSGEAYLIDRAKEDYQVLLDKIGE